MPKSEKKKTSKEEKAQAALELCQDVKPKRRKINGPCIGRKEQRHGVEQLGGYC